MNRNITIYNRHQNGESMASREIDRRYGSEAARLLIDAIRSALTREE